MAVKPKITVDVDDAAFAAFHAKFLAYQASLEQTPEAWRKVGEAASDAASAYGDVAKAAENHASAVESAAEGAGKLSSATQTTARLWHDMGRSTALVAKNIAHMTQSLLAWSGLTGLLGGGILGGGVLGLDAIASRVTSTRARALGTGTSIGNFRAADIAYSRFVGSNSGSQFAGQIRDWQFDPNKRAWLHQLLPGWSDEAIANADPTEIEGAVLQSAHKRAQGESRGQLGTDPLWQHLGIDSQTLNILHGNQISDSEYSAAQNTFNSSKAGLNPADQRGWADFQQVLATSKSEIETTFIDRLSKLDAPLGDLVHDFSDLAVKVIDSDAFGDAMNDVDDGLKWLSGKMNDPNFRAGVDHFVEGIGHLATELGDLGSEVISFAKWLDPGAWKDTPGGIGASSTASGGGVGPGEGMGTPRLVGSAGGGGTPFQGAQSGSVSSPALIGSRSSAAAASSTASGGGFANFSGDTNPALTSAIVQAEGTAKGGRNPYDTTLNYYSTPKPLTDMTNSQVMAMAAEHRWHNSTAKGAFQIENSTQRDAMRSLGIGGDDLYSEQNQIRMRDWIWKRQGAAAWQGFEAHPDLEAKANAAAAGGFRGAPIHDASNVRTKTATGQPALPFFARTIALTVSSTPGSNPVTAASQMGTLSGALQ